MNRLLIFLGATFWLICVAAFTIPNLAVNIIAAAFAVSGSVMIAAGCIVSAIDRQRAAIRQG